MKRPTIVNAKTPIDSPQQDSQQVDIPRPCKKLSQAFNGKLLRQNHADLNAGKHTKASSLTRYNEGSSE